MEVPFIPESEFEFSFARSSGPGGQNVNKVNSKAILRWSPALSGSLSLEIRQRLLDRLARRLNDAGELLITSDRFRDQIRNREDCIEKLREILKAALHVPKARKKSKPSRSAQRRTRESKKRHSEKKSMRRSFRY